MSPTFPAVTVTSLPSAVGGVPLVIVQCTVCASVTARAVNTVPARTVDGASTVMVGFAHSSTEYAVTLGPTAQLDAPSPLPPVARLRAPPAVVVIETCFAPEVDGM